VTATEVGDSIRFEQATPAGKHVWTTKKNELTPKEQALIEQTKPATSQREK
jgi:hypothetical protein